MQNKIRPYIEAALLVSIALILSAIPIWKAPLGGSVTLGATIPVCIISIRWGPKIGMLCGLNYGILNFLTGGVLVGIGPFFLDYLLAHTLLGAFGWMKNPLAGILTAQFSRLVCHVLSGILFFSPGLGWEAATLVSLQYNLFYMVPEVGIGIVVFLKLIGSKNSGLLEAEIN